MKNWLHDPIWFTPPDGSSKSLWKSSPSPPPAPDYTGAARAQGAANVDTAVTEGILNRPNQITPYGNLTYDKSGSFMTPGGQEVPQFTSTVSLSPTGQKLFDQQQQISSGLGDIAVGGINRVGATFGTPFDMSKVPNAPDLNNTTSRDAVTAALLQREQPFMDRARSMKENALAVGGFNPGGEAWKSAQDDLARSENDARLAAVQAGGQEQSRLYGLQQEARQQGIGEQAYLRSLPLNEINALRTGAQVTPPQFQPNGGAAVGQTPIFNAAQQQAQYGQNVYNQEAAAANAGNSGLLSAAGSIGAAALFY